MVRPKKFLGQHFLVDKNIASKIVDSLVLSASDDIQVIEIGPGTGVLTEFLTVRGLGLSLVEIDRESVSYLRERFPELHEDIIRQDFLTLNLDRWGNKRLHIIGNFPYNISSQIFFHLLDFVDQVDQVVCMLQKEVGERIACPPGSKTYGILSVFLQAYYDIENLFKVPPEVFHPPPKVMSVVIRLTRNNRKELECNELLFRKVVKQGFQNRRKTLRNALKSLNLPTHLSGSGGPIASLLDKRAEQLTVDQFILLTKVAETQ